PAQDRTKHADRVESLMGEHGVVNRIPPPPGEIAAHARLHVVESVLERLRQRLIARLLLRCLHIVTPWTRPGGHDIHDKASDVRKASFVRWEDLRSELVTDKSRRKMVEPRLKDRGGGAVGRCAEIPLTENVDRLLGARIVSDHVAEQQRQKRLRMKREPV